MCEGFINFFNNKEKFKKNLADEDADVQILANYSQYYKKTYQIKRRKL